MENLTLVKKDDRCFLNPFLTSKQTTISVSEESKNKIAAVASSLFANWEKDIKAEIEYTGKWKNYSIYTGIAGYALLYLEASKLLGNRDYLDQSFFMVEKCCMHLDGDVLTFLIGDGGPLALGAVCCHLLEQPEKQQHFTHRLEKLYHSIEALANPTDNLPDELLYGRIGCLYALLFIKQSIKGAVNEQLITTIAKTVIESGRRLATKLKKKGHKVPPLMFEWHQKKYLGPAHGLAGILYILLQLKDSLGMDTMENEIRPCIEFLLETRFASGNFPSSLESDQDRLVQWCHGAPGFVHFLVAASQVFDCEKYMLAAKQCADVTWERGVLTKGFSICHGMAGNGFAFLQLYQHTKDPLYLNRAFKFAEIITEAAPHEFRTPDRPLSLYEGTAGVILFLLSLSQPEKASFSGYQLNLLNSLQ